MLSLTQAARDCPDQLALLDDDRALSFRQLHQGSRALLEGLVEQGLAALLDRTPARPWVPVAFEGNNDVETLVLLYALLDARVPFLPLHPRLTPAEQTNLVERAGAVWLRRDGSRWTVQATPGGKRDFEGPPPAVLIATSGTTATARLVRLSYTALEASAQATWDWLGDCDDDRWQLSLGIAHVGGLSILTRCLLRRCPVIVDDPASEPEIRLGRLLRHHCTLLSLVPAQLEPLLATPFDARRLRLRALLLGGARASPRLTEQAKKAGWPVLLTYGMTEMASQVTAQPLSDLDDDPNEHTRDAGLPMAGVEVRIVLGRIEVRGRSLFDGYLGQSPSPLTEDGWYATSDLGILDQQGRLVSEGRRSDRIVTGGENVSPAEVEAVLEACPAVVAAGVVGLDDERWGSVVAAAYVTDPLDCSPETSIIEQLQSLCAERLAPFKRPRRYLRLARLPLNAQGKLDRRALLGAFSTSTGDVSDPGQVPHLPR